MPLLTYGALVGVAKQTAKGTIAANPTFSHGLSGGAPIVVEPSQSSLEVTAAKRVRTNVIRESVMNSGEVQAPGYLKSIGLYLLGALGTDTVTGTSPYVHTFATGDLPYLTVFAKGIDSTIEAIRDCKIEELSLKWSGSKPLELSVKYQGTVFSYPSTFTATTDETGSESFLVPIGGTFTVDPIGSTQVAATVTGGEITIKNSVAPIEPSASIEASDITDGIQEFSIKLTIVPDDLLAFRKTVTGAAAGTASTAVVPYGSVTTVFKENNGTGQLSVTGSKVAFLTSFPDVSTKGDAIEIELAGIPVLPSGGTAPLVFALSNAQASY